LVLLVLLVNQVLLVLLAFQEKWDLLDLLDLDFNVQLQLVLKPNKAHHQLPAAKVATLQLAVALTVKLETGSFILNQSSPQTLQLQLAGKGFATMELRKPMLFVVSQEVLMEVLMVAVVVTAQLQAINCNKKTLTGEEVVNCHRLILLELLL